MPRAGPVIMPASEWERSMKANVSANFSRFSLLRAKQLYNSAPEKSHPDFTTLISLHFSHTALFIGLIEL